MNLGNKEKNSRLKAGTALHHPFISSIKETFDDGFLMNYFKIHRSSLPLRDREEDILKMCLKSLA